MSASGWLLAGGLALVGPAPAPDGELAPLPDPVGVAGAVVGVLPEGLLVAGGANFPEAPPWEGGAKAYHDRVHLLGEGGVWRTLEERLPEPRAYGVSVSTPRGVIVAGGHDAQRVHDSVLRLSVVDGRLVVERLATLPAPRTNAGGALLARRQRDDARADGRRIRVVIAEIP